MRALMLCVSLVCSWANAETVAHVVAPNGRLLTLDDKQGVCKPQFLVAELFGPEGKKLFQGCWQLRGAAIHIDWEDGDVSDIPAQVFTGGPKGGV